MKYGTGIWRGEYVFLLVPTVECLSFTLSLTPEDCFYIHLLKVESCSVITETPVLIGEPMSRICDITNSLEPILDQYTIYKCDVET